MPLDVAIDTDKLATLLQGMIMVSLRASPREIEFGHPCSWLIEQSIKNGCVYVAIDMAEQLRQGNLEYRLNGAGLKLLGSTAPSRNGGGPRTAFLVIYTGDQFDRYPTTGPQLQQLIDESFFKRPSYL